MKDHEVQNMTAHDEARRVAMKPFETTHFAVGIRNTPLSSAREPLPSRVVARAPACLAHLLEPKRHA